MKKRKRRRIIIILAVAAIGLYLWNRPTTQAAAPDKKLAKNFVAMCGIAGDHIKTPSEGVDALGRYLAEHGPVMMQQFGELVVVIERIGDDSAHDERARKAHKTLVRPLKRCERTWARFFTAVEADPVASRKLEGAVNRLGRTLEIIFGADTGSLPFGLPSPRQFVQAR